MNIKHFSLVLTISFCIQLAGFAQTSTSYVVHVGAIEGLESAALNSLSEIGNIYFTPTSAADKNEVMIGSFDDLSKAEAVIQSLNNKGFANAYAAPLPTSKGVDIHVIQLAKGNSMEQIDWSAVQAVGKAYSIVKQGSVKVVTGLYPDYQSALPRQNELYQAGFVDAQILKINSIYLHELTSADIAFQQSVKGREIGNVTEFTAKGGVSAYSMEDEIPPAVNRVALSKSIAPAINETLARNSVKNLQSLLAIYGTFNEEPNGRYDDKTANGYYATVQLDPILKKYSAVVENKSSITSGFFTDWSDVKLLMAISEDITNRKIELGDAELKALVSLYKSPKVLGVADAEKVNAWRLKLNTQFEAWVSTGKLNAESQKAYMLVSNKAQVLLEDYFLNKGFAIPDASNLAKATMYALLVGNYQYI